LVALGRVRAGHAALVLDRDDGIDARLALVVHDLPAGGARLGPRRGPGEGEGQKQPARNKQTLHGMVLQGGPPPPQLFHSVTPGRPGLEPLPVANGVLGPRLREALEAQEAALAGAARLGLGLIARPGLIEWGRALSSLPDDRGLGQLDPVLD